MLYFFLLIILITDFSGYQDLLLPKKLVKFKRLNHLFRCSFCQTFWFSIIAHVFFDQQPIWIIFSFLTPLLSLFIGILFDKLRDILSKLSNL